MSPWLRTLSPAVPTALSGFSAARIGTGLYHGGGGVCTDLQCTVYKSMCTVLRVVSVFFVESSLCFFLLLVFSPAAVARNSLGSDQLFVFRHNRLYPFLKTIYESHRRNSEESEVRWPAASPSLASLFSSELLHSPSASPLNLTQSAFTLGQHTT